MASILPPDRAAGERLTRVVVTGSESTGKTSLAEQLARHYDVPWIAEFARDYAEKKGSPLTIADVDPIGRGQVAREDAQLRVAQNLIILDTDLVSTLVYSQQYYRAVPGWLPGVAKQRVSELYLLCDIDLPWVADRVRDAQHQRQQMHDAFIDQLKRFGATYRLIGGSAAQRLARAIDSIDATRYLSQP
jgi:NadR type nicotinamide-nucleotide adenylyltransferase